MYNGALFDPARSRDTGLLLQKNQRFDRPSMAIGKSVIKLLSASADGSHVIASFVVTATRLPRRAVGGAKHRHLLTRAGAEGLEPATAGFGNQCSAN